MFLLNLPEEVYFYKETSLVLGICYNALLLI